MLILHTWVSFTKTVQARIPHICSQIRISLILAGIVTQVFTRYSGSQIYKCLVKRAPGNLRYVMKLEQGCDKD